MWFEFGHVIYMYDVFDINNIGNCRIRAHLTVMLDLNNSLLLKNLFKCLHLFGIDGHSYVTGVAKVK